jgi:hypothetical protein
MPLGQSYINQINYIDNYNKSHSKLHTGYSVINKRKNYTTKTTKLNINNSKSVRNISNYNYEF